MKRFFSFIKPWLKIKSICVIFLILHICGFSVLSSPLFQADFCICSINAQLGHQPSCNCKCKMRQSKDTRENKHCNAMMPAPGSQPESKNKSQKEDTNDTSLRRIPCHPESKNGINLSIGIDLMAADFFLLYPTKINSRDIWLNSIYLTSFSFNLYEKPS